ncbi:MAG: chorismate mutase [Desulfarculales bacterium]|jgi:chorismate mutase/prephenate dehydratase|nr:chorismate mutase [Desulfarculales bacterium]
MGDWDKIRDEIDLLDKDILKLLNMRARRVMEAGRVEQTGAGSLFSSLRPARIGRGLLKENRGPLPEAALKYLFGEIDGACLNITAPLKVAVLGPEGSFCHQAAARYFGASSQFRPLPSIVDVFAELDRDYCHVGVVPVENSSECETDSTLDQFFISPLKICGEVYAPSHPALFSGSESLAAISDIYANPITLSLCRGWLSRNLPYARVHERAGVNAAVDSILDKPQAAALGSRLAANLAKLNILAADIADQKLGLTRFLVLGRQSPPPSGGDKTSILFTMTHKPGFLYEALGYLRALNLTRIESRPSLDESWNYSLFVDMDGHVSDREVDLALQGLSAYAAGFKILGSYPKGEILAGKE